MALSGKWPHYHTAFISGGLVVNFFREERYAASRGLDFDVVPFGSDELVFDKIIPSCERYNTGGSGVAITVRIGIFQDGRPVWCDETTGQVHIEPFADNTSALRAVWRGGQGLEVSLFLFPGIDGTVDAQISSNGASRLLIELSGPEELVPGLVAYTAAYDRRDGSIAFEQPDYAYRIQARLSPVPDEFQLGIVGALAGEAVDPPVQWERDGRLGCKAEAGLRPGSEERRDYGVMSCSAPDVHQKPVPYSPAAVRAWFVIPGREAGLHIRGIFAGEPSAKSSVAEERERFENVWRDRLARTGVTEACGVDAGWSLGQIARLMSAYSRHPLHPERAGAGAAAGSSYWEWLNFRDSSQVAQMLTAVGLIEEARAVYETWWGHFTEGGKPWHRNITYNGIIDTLCTEIPGFRIVSLFRHVLMTGDLEWARRRALPMALWLAQALHERIDPETGFVLGGSQEQDLLVGSPGFDMVVQCTTIAGFESLGRLMDVMGEPEATDWTARAEVLREAVRDRYPVLPNGLPATRFSKDGTTESFLDVFTIAFLILDNVFPLDDPRIAAAIAGIRELAAPVPEGTPWQPYWGRRGTSDPRASDWGRSWIMMPHQGEPVGTAWMRLGKSREAEEVLRLHLEVAARDPYQCMVEQEEFLPEATREDKDSLGERSARELVRSFVWGPFPWLTAQTLHMLNSEGFCVLADTEGHPVFLHANPVFAPYSRKSAAAAQFDGHTVRFGDKTLAHMDGPGDISVCWPLRVAEIRALERPLTVELNVPGIRGIHAPSAGVEWSAGKATARIRPYDRIWLRWL